MTLADGYHDVPAGKIAAVVTYLEMCAPPVFDRAPLSPGVAITHTPTPDVAEYRRWFREIGAPWLWFSRLRLDDAALRDVLSNPAVEVHALTRDGVTRGFVELDRRAAPDVEIAFVGVAPEVTGTGLGSALLNYALRRAWAERPRRVILHTCSLDHPRALPFYLRAGFRAYRRAVEVADDPRLLGLLPREAAPHVPIVEP